MLHHPLSEKQKARTSDAGTKSSLPELPGSHASLLQLTQLLGSGELSLLGDLVVVHSAAVAKSAVKLLLQGRHDMGSYFQRCSPLQASGNVVDVLGLVSVENDWDGACQHQSWISLIGSGYSPLCSSLRTSLECSLASAEVLGLWMVALWPPMT